MADLVAKFNIYRVSKSGAKFSKDKMTYFNS